MYMLQHINTSILIEYSNNFMNECGIIDTNKRIRSNCMSEFIAHHHNMGITSESVDGGGCGLGGGACTTGGATTGGGGGGAGC
jgi:hypothetical protein